MFEQSFVEEEDVAERSGQEVEKSCVDVHYNIQGQELSPYIILCPGFRVDVGCKEVIIAQLQNHIHGSTDSL